MLHVLESTSGPPGDELEFDASLFRAVEDTGHVEVLRVWDVASPAVVIGHGERMDDAVDQAACAADGVPIVRRLTGGGAVVIGPGCLNVSLVLSLDLRPPLRDVTNSYRVILGAIIGALAIPGLAHRGVSDVARGDLKVSGNAQRRGRRALLHQSTLLWGFDLPLIARYLREPRRQPDYRANRRHDAFVTNLPIAVQELRARIRDVAALTELDTLDACGARCPAAPAPAAMALLPRWPSR